MTSVNAGWRYEEFESLSLGESRRCRPQTLADFVADVLEMPFERPKLAHGVICQGLFFVGRMPLEMVSQVAQLAQRINQRFGVGSVAAFLGKAFLEQFEGAPVILGLDTQRLGQLAQFRLQKTFIDELIEQ